MSRLAPFHFSRYCEIPVPMRPTVAIKVSDKWHRGLNGSRGSKKPTHCSGDIFLRTSGTNSFLQVAGGRVIARAVPVLQRPLGKGSGGGDGSSGQGVTLGDSMRAGTPPPVLVTEQVRPPHHPNGHFCPPFIAIFQGGRSQGQRHFGK